MAFGVPHGAVHGFLGGPGCAPFGHSSLILPIFATTAHKSSYSIMPPSSVSPRNADQSSEFRLIAPVLFIGFNRIGPAEQVFEAIRAARPAKLYFACDGPRNADEAVHCEEVRALAKRVDWPCELHTHFNDRNLGLRKGVSAAINWFFEHESEGIVLEDDTLPVPTFFRFCQEMLERYREDERIWVVMGNNLMTEYQGQQYGSYYYSAHGYGAPWGWASWRRVWSHYDVDMAIWPAVRNTTLLSDFFLNKAEEREVHSIFENVHKGAINSWSYQLDVMRICNHGLNILPYTDLVRNIGFGPEGTHTVSLKDPRNKDTARDIQFPLHHPPFIMLDGRRDAEYFRRYIGATPLIRIKKAVKQMLGGDKGLVMRTWMDLKGGRTKAN